MTLFERKTDTQADVVKTSAAGSKLCDQLEVVKRLVAALKRQSANARKALIRLASRMTQTHANFRARVAIVDARLGALSFMSSDLSASRQRGQQNETAFGRESRDESFSGSGIGKR